MNQKTLSESPKWDLLLAEQDASRQAELCTELAASVDGEEIEYLVSLLDLRGRSTRAALKVLIATARYRPQLLGGERQREIVGRLEPLLHDYPNNLGLSAFYLLRLVDRDRAEKFLIDATKSGRLTDREKRTLIADLCLLQSSSLVRDLLEEIEKRGGEAGAEARRRLENLGYTNGEELDALGRKWRQTRMREPLNRLFEMFISRQGGQPIASVLEILGPPSERKDSRYFYHTTDGLTLYLEEDDQERLTAMRIK
jgi:hypothetical protein